MDALNTAGGLTIPPSQRPSIVLIRGDSRGRSFTHRYEIDLDALTNGGDRATDYELIPGDRLIVTSPKPDAATESPKQGGVRP